MPAGMDAGSSDDDDGPDGRGEVSRSSGSMELELERRLLTKKNGMGGCVDVMIVATHQARRDLTSPDWMGWATAQVTR